MIYHLPSTLGDGTRNLYGHMGPRRMPDIRPLLRTVQTARGQPDDSLACVWSHELDREGGGLGYAPFVPERKERKRSITFLWIHCIHYSARPRVVRRGLLLRDSHFQPFPSVGGAVCAPCRIGRKAGHDPWLTGSWWTKRAGRSRPEQAGASGCARLTHASVLLRHCLRKAFLTLLRIGWVPASYPRHQGSKRG